MSRRLITCADVALVPDGQWITVAGLVITRQRPGTASGVIFLTLEDETGTANVVVWTKIYEKFRRAVIGGRLLRVHGRLQREGAVTHLIAHRIESLSALLDSLGLPDDPALARADETRRQVVDARAALAEHGSKRADHTTRSMMTPGQMKVAKATRGAPSPTAWERQGQASEPAAREKIVPRAQHPRDQAKQLFPSRDFH